MERADPQKIGLRFRFPYFLAHILNWFPSSKRIKPFPTTHLGSRQYSACSWLRDSRACWIKKARRRKQNGRKLPTFRVPFTFASSPLSESLEQARQYWDIRYDIWKIRVGVSGMLHEIFTLVWTKICDFSQPNFGPELMFSRGEWKNSNAKP